MQKVLSDFVNRWQIGLSWQGRALVALAGAWRIWELLAFAMDVRGATPWTPLMAEHPFYRFHPMLTPLHELYLLGAVITLSYGVWAWHGGLWAWPAIFLAPLLGQQGLPLGWGLLALQPLLLLDAAQSDGPPVVRKWLPLVMITQLTLMYWGSAWGKDVGVWWNDASAIRDALKGEYLPTFLGHALGEWIDSTGLSEWLSRATVVAQVLLPLVIFLPGARSFQAIKSVAIAFHLSIAVLFHIAPFSLACVAFWLALSAVPASGVALVKPRWREIGALVALSLWFAGALAGTLRLQSDFLQRWSFAQSWRIMQRAEPRGHSVVEMKQKKFALEGEKRWEMAAAFALSTTPKLRREWLRAACGPEDKELELIVKHSTHAMKTKDYRQPCP